MSRFISLHVIKCFGQLTSRQPERREERERDEVRCRGAGKAWPLLAQGMVRLLPHFHTFLYKLLLFYLHLWNIYIWLITYVWMLLLVQLLLVFIPFSCELMVHLSFCHRWELMYGMGVQNFWGETARLSIGLLYMVRVEYCDLTKWDG